MWIAKTIFLICPTLCLLFLFLFRFALPFNISLVMEFGLFCSALLFSPPFLPQFFFFWFIMYMGSHCILEVLICLLLTMQIVAYYEKSSSQVSI